MTTTLLDGLILLAVVGVVSGLARRLGVLRPILLLVVGGILSYVPHVLDVHLEPDLVLEIFLPLLVYIATMDSSLPALKASVRPVVWLAVGHVVFVTVVVGFVVHAVVPQFPLAAAFALGAVVSPPDAVSATAIARRVGLPRRIVTILEGESMLNDATALVLLRVAVAAATGSVVTWHGVLLQLLYAAAVGVVIGAAVALLAAWLQSRTDDPLLGATISILTPFMAFVPTEYVHASGVAAVAVCGIYLSHRKPRMLSAASRLQMDTFWRVVQFLLEGIVFVLVGLQIRFVLDALDQPYRIVVLATVGVLVVVVVGRFVWVGSGYLVGLLPVPGLTTGRAGRAGRGGRQGSGGPRAPRAMNDVRARGLAVVSWAGMRGVITLAAAMALPVGFPERNLIVWIAFEVIIVTLVGQGFTLPAFARWVGLSGDDRQADLLAEASARQAAYRAAVERIQALGLDKEEYEPFVQRLEALAENRAHRAWERLGSTQKDPPSEILRRLRLEMIDAERDALLEARDAGRLPDDVLRRVQRELDLEELMMARGRDDEEDT